MNKYRQFIFKKYQFDPDSHLLNLFYGYDDGPDFCETYNFDFPFVDYNPQALDRALQLLFFVAGVSYYKAFLAPELAIQAGQIDQQLSDFLSRTYQKGLGEFYYINNLDARSKINFPVNSDGIQSLSFKSDGILVGIGGGKDSLVSLELLRKTGTEFTTWSLNHKAQLSPLVDRIGSQHLWVERQWDQQLLDLKNDPAAYNGHIPISAIIGCVGVIVAILSGNQDVTVSNESSANQPTLHYQDLAINHQYSKSMEFERDFQSVLREFFNNSVRYYSFLRPLGELRISELFAGTAFEKYKDVFSSCNRAFTHDSNSIFWDGKCPKCAFVFLALTPFIDRQELEGLFNGKNLLLDTDLETTYRQLLGIEGDRPLECVGEVKECRAAMRLAQQKYPELEKYQFELPDDYDFRALSDHAMPNEAFEILKAALT